MENKIKYVLVSKCRYWYKVLVNWSFLSSHFNVRIIGRYQEYFWYLKKCKSVLIFAYLFVWILIYYTVYRNDLTHSYVTLLYDNNVYIYYK